MHSETITFAEEINRAQQRAMLDDPSMIAMGLGIDDPGRIFGTTKHLRESFGSERVFDIPTAENGMTGIAIGAAQAGTRVLMTHQRLDFFLLAMDQLVNNAAKWRYMFNGQMEVPLTIRLIIGRGWGQGPTHAQNLTSWFAHIPGLKVVVPSTAGTVASQLYHSIMDNNPVLFLEHRWLHNQIVAREAVTTSCGLMPYQRINRGSDITIVCSSYMTLEVMTANKFLSSVGVSADIIDLMQMNPLDLTAVFESVQRTGHLLVVDTSAKVCSLSSEIITEVVKHCFSDLKKPPQRMTLPDLPEPTSYSLTKHFYNDADDIIDRVAKLLGEDWKRQPVKRQDHDVPGKWFTGPF